MTNSIMINTIKNGEEDLFNIFKTYQLTKTGNKNGKIWSIPGRLYSLPTK